MPDQLPQRGEDLLGQGDDVLLLDERGLDVELGEFGLAVGAEVLVTVAASDLVVAFHARDLEQLFEQLRGLGQGVRSEEHTSELQSRGHLVCRLLLEKKNNCKYTVRNRAETC